MSELKHASLYLKNKYRRMFLSKSCEYGIKAIIHIAQQSLKHERSNLKEISTKIGSPEAFTAKILQALVKEGFIKSTKGAAGGFEMEQKKIKKIKLIDIVHAIDGDAQEKMCVLGLSICSELQPCPVHHKYKEIKKDMLTMLQKTGLIEMTERINDGISYLKI